MGPGIGESVVIHFPCGGWGVVDCYHTEKSGTLEFLKEKNVERLKFFCLTHPHEDHYRGGHKLLEHFHGKIERVWLFPGINAKHFVSLGAATRIRYKYVGESRAEEMADEYTRLLKALIRERMLLDDDHYRRVIAYSNYPLLEDPQYSIQATGPGSIAVDKFTEQFAREAFKTGPLLLSEEGGQFINSLSIVLRITFGKSRVFLLGDSQGRNIALEQQDSTTLTLVKLAHHGSDNGLGAQYLTLPGAPRFNHGFVTPYLRSGLPRENMLKAYAGACRVLVQTGPEGESRFPRFCAFAKNARIPQAEVAWPGLEVSNNGRVRRIV
jgi:hypothetical protein